MVRGKVWVSGAIVDPGQAVISVFDRGFLYGDSVYETLRIYGRVPFAMDEHLSGCSASGAKVGFDIPWEPAVIHDAVERTRAAANLDEGYLRIIATRGGGVISLDPGAAADPQLVIMVLELPPLPNTLYEDGRAVALVSVQRNLKGALDPQAKTGNYMNSVLAMRDARGRGADDAIMLDHAGRVAEASSANVFVLQDGVWCTPPLEVGILSGITRKTLLALCRREGIRVEERILWPADLEKAPEIFLCSSVREVVPVTRLDGRPVGSGKAGPATRRLHALYRAEVASRTTA